MGRPRSGAARRDRSLDLLHLVLLLRDRERFRAAASELLPLPPGRFEELAAIVHKSIVNNFYGMFAVSVTQGILT